MPYARDTDVSPERSLIEIKAALKRYGADKFAMMEDADRFAVAFEFNQRRIRFVVPIPSEDELAKTRHGKTRTPAAVTNARNQAIRQRWRALLLVIKAKLESIEAGIETMDEAFMAQLVLPSGQTMAEWAAPQIERAYVSGSMPPLLGSGD